MIQVLHYVKDPKLRELWSIPYVGANAGFIPSAVVGPGTAELTSQHHCLGVLVCVEFRV